MTGHRSTHPIPKSALRHRVERAALGTGWCYRCGRPWKTSARKYEGFHDGVHRWRQLNRQAWWGILGVEPHITRWSSSQGCFPLCEGCWSALTIEERIPFYRALVDEWIRQMPDHRDDYEDDRPSIYLAVLDGR